MYIYLDESGNFIGDKDKYFIIGGFITDTPRRTAKAFRKWQHAKFPKKVRRKNEVKFTDSGINKTLHWKTINYLSKQDLRIFYIFLNTANIPLEYRNKKGIETGRLYTQIVGDALELILPTTAAEFKVFLDKRPLKGISAQEFKEVLKLRIFPHLPKGAVLQIETVDSATQPNVQIADWICGAFSAFHNKKDAGKEYFDSLRNSVVGEKELFPKYWKDNFVE